MSCNAIKRPISSDINKSAFIVDQSLSL